MSDTGPESSQSLLCPEWAGLTAGSRGKACLNFLEGTVHAPPHTGIPGLPLHGQGAPTASAPSCRSGCRGFLQEVWCQLSGPSPKSAPTSYMGEFQDAVSSTGFQRHCSLLANVTALGGGGFVPGNRTRSGEGVGGVVVMLPLDLEGGRHFVSDLCIFCFRKPVWKSGKRATMLILW